MALIPITIRCRLRDSGFTEEQANTLDEVSEATAEAAREGMAEESTVNSHFAALHLEMAALRNEMSMFRAEMAAM